MHLAVPWKWGTTVFLFFSSRAAGSFCVNRSLAEDRNYTIWSKGFRTGHHKYFTETGNRAWEVSGAQGSLAVAASRELSGTRRV